jgi:hypothetical protein
VGPRAERRCPDRHEHLVGDAQLLACVGMAILAPQPFAIDEMGAGEMNRDSAPTEPVDRLSIQILGDLALA